jgi:hypothetical protein
MPQNPSLWVIDDSVWVSGPSRVPASTTSPPGSTRTAHLDVAWHGQLDDSLSAQVRANGEDESLASANS